MIDPTNPDYTDTPCSPQRPCFGYAPLEASAPPYVTLVTPFYNTDSVFHETARSVLQQSFQQWEWLIVNDGSTTPESIATLQAYRQCDARIRVIDHATNMGLSAARNTGFRTAQTEYVVQLDSDDLLESTAVEKWLWFLESHPEFAFAKGYSVGFGAQEYLWQQGFHNGESFLYENLVAATSMVRKSAWHDAGGYDESIRGGLEDWEFWLRCANHGDWGGTIPEFLDWYRRRPTHGDRWHNIDIRMRQNFHEGLRQRYPRLWKGGFPKIQQRRCVPYDAMRDELRCENRLRKDKLRLLMIIPWLTMGGADKFNLDLLAQLTQRGWEVTLVTTLSGDHSWLPIFARYTPDIFVLHHLLPAADYPRFLRYLIQSRQVDVVLVSNSELGYQLLPYLRAHFPKLAFMDFCHMEEEHWKNGGYPRMAVEHQKLLDLNVVASAYLKRWMVKRGGDPQRIEVCHINVDTEQWSPDAARRIRLQQELELDSSLPVVLYAGRIGPQKQPRVFAKTMLQLSQKAVPFVALVAGDGPDLRWLRAFVKRHGLGKRIRLLGAVPNERVRELMMAGDLFFLPSQWEGIALTLYEAMACGLPVVGADVGGQAELVTPECGVLIARNNEHTEVKHYTAALADLLGNPQRCQQMGQAGRLRVIAHFRLEQMGERINLLLQEAMRLHSTQPRPIVSLELGRISAWQAVESVRLFQTAEQLWWRHEQHLKDIASWRALVYFTMRRLLFPLYHAALKRGMTWVIPLKDKFKLVLLR